MRVTARINNGKITAQSSVFKHSLKSHQPWRQANGGRGGEGEKLSTYKAHYCNNNNSAVLAKYTHAEQRLGEKLQGDVNLCSIKTRLVVVRQERKGDMVRVCVFVYLHMCHCMSSNPFFWISV